MSPEEELALKLKVEYIVSVTIHLTAALMALRKAVDIISHQPTLILSQMDRTEIGKELAETVDQIDKSLASLERLFAKRVPDG